MVETVEPHPTFSGVYKITQDNKMLTLATRNFAPGKKVYGERLVTYKNVEYRAWNPFRSKLAAAILKGLAVMPITHGDKVLYLGAASGTTASHVSDIVGVKGHVYCVEFAPRAMRELVSSVCAFRINTTPILEDARMPERYAMFLEKVDVIYCDIAQPAQAKVLADNADSFLKATGWIMLAVKSQSIDVTEDPVKVYKQQERILKDRGFNNRSVVQLEPYDKAHAMIVSKI